ncbi:MAG: hypothetical protein O7C56_02525 [Rickettsia endosymbiont of Ixodes persulcatus]|nr:hypothetical protein [Rickettsia endosymbiont of Ixodes persulcatus]
MASADDKRSDELTPVEAQRIAERAAETLGTAAANGPADAQRLAERAAEALFARDSAAKLLGYHVISVAPGSARVGMTVRNDMCNGHRTCHRGRLNAICRRRNFEVA